MKKIVVTVLVVLMTIGFGAPAHALLTFDVDFWATDNPVHNYDQEGPGSGDLGDTFILFPEEQINVDIYFSTDQEYVAASWDMQYSPGTLASAIGTTEAGMPWGLALTELNPGSVKYQSVIFPQGDTISGDDIFFGSVNFQCTGPGVVDLVLSNYLGFLTATGADTIVDVNLGTLQQRPVPIPGALWLLGSGLVGLIALKRKKARTDMP